MKVLMLGWELPPFNSGGLGVACLQLSRALAASGADIEFVLPHYSGPAYDHMKVTSAFTKPGDYMYLVNAYDSQLYTEPGDDSNIIPEAFEDSVSYIASSRKFDVIHAHDWLTFRAALRAKWETGVPLVIHVHSIERDRAGGQAGSPMVREIEGTAMLLADQIIAVSEHTKQAIIEDYSVPADKIVVVHNSVDPADFSLLQEQTDYLYIELMKARGWKVMSYVGRLTIQKGLVQLLEAAAEAMDRVPKTFVLLIGSGEQRDELIELAAALGIADRVFFADFQRGKRLREAFMLSDLFVMPSVSEPFGLVALEAAGYGAPVLISKQSGVSEVLNSCLKVDYWDIQEMANLMAGVLQNQTLGKELSDKALSEINLLSWTKPAQKVMDIYTAQALETAA